MHMADPLVSPLVGGVLWTFALSVGGCSVRKVRSLAEEKSSAVPLIGVAAAFVFAAQMINFSIPGTGSSGHIGGGLFLSILLGPHAAFLSMVIILLIQALFFADGGILSLGANIINMGFMTCFIAYPFVYQPLMKRQFSGKVLFPAAIASSVVGLQLGSFAVVTETFLSGKTALPFSAFLLLMQPIHLAIGLIEGVLTAILVRYLYRHAPELMSRNEEHTLDKSRKKIILILALSGLFCGGVLSLFASGNPDGLEWSIAKTTDPAALESSPGRIQLWFQTVQDFFAFLPDYDFRNTSEEQESSRLGTSLSGIAGSLLTMLGMTGTILIIALVKHKKKRRLSG